MGALVDVRLGSLRGPAVAGLTAAVGLNLLPGPDGVPCPLRALTGVPCPLCGTTTSVSATARGDLGAAVAASPVGLALVVLAVVVALGLLDRRRLRLPAWTVLLGLVGLWGFQLVRFDVV